MRWVRFCKVMGLTRNSVTPASRAASTRSRSVWPLTMMMGTAGLYLRSSPPHLAGEFQPVHRLHRHVRQDQVAALGALDFQPMLAMDGFIYLMHAQRIEHGPEQA